MSGSVLVLGAANLDLKGRLFSKPVVNSSNAAAIKSSMGGVARNIAENLARLGVPVTLLTAVGADYAGEDILDTADDLGMDVSRALVIEGEPTGAYLAALNPGGEMFMALDDVRVLRHLTPDYLYLNRDAFKSCDIVAMDLNLSDAALRTAIALAREYDKPVCIDPTSADIAHRLCPFLTQVNLITPNLDEAKVLLRQSAQLPQENPLLAARQLVGLGVEAAIITQAEKGACYATEHESGEFPALRGEIVDTTGAGDALTAAVIFGMLQGMPVGDALQLGLRAAALTLHSAYTVAPELSVDRLYGLDS